MSAGPPERKCMNVVVDVGRDDVALSSEERARLRRVAGARLTYLADGFLTDVKKKDEFGILSTSGAQDSRAFANGLRWVYLAQPPNARLVLESIKAETEDATAKATGSLHQGIQLAREELFIRVPERLKCLRCLHLIVASETSRREELEEAMGACRGDPEVQVEATIVALEHDAQAESAVEMWRGLGAKSAVVVTSVSDASSPPFVPVVVRQTKKFKGVLRVGTAEMYVCSVAKTQVRKPKSLIRKSREALSIKGAYLREKRLKGDGAPKDVKPEKTEDGDEDEALDEEEAQMREWLGNLESETRKIDTATGAESVGISTGYMFGKTIIPLVGADEEALAWNSIEQHGLSVLGFADRGSVGFDVVISTSDCLVAEQEAANSRRGFAALVRAMLAADRVAVARYVKKDEAAPRLVGLFPGSTPAYDFPDVDVDCLWLVELATDDDIRDFSFEPFEGINLTQPEKSAMQSYVNAMLLKPGVDAAHTRGYDPLHTYNPFFVSWYDLIRKRALYPEALPASVAIPEARKWLAPDMKVVERALPKAEEVQSAFGLKRVKLNTTAALPQVAAAEPEAAAASAAPAGVEDWFGGNRWVDTSAAPLVEAVGELHPVEDFQAMLDRKDTDMSDAAILQMQHRIEAFAMGEATPEESLPLFEKAVRCLVAVRGAVVNLGYHRAAYNAMLNSLRGQVGINSEFWRQYVLPAKEAIRLIVGPEEGLCATEEEAAAFFTDAAVTATQTQATQSAAPVASIMMDLEDELE